MIVERPVPAIKGALKTWGHYQHDTGGNLKGLSLASWGQFKHQMNKDKNTHVNK